MPNRKRRHMDREPSLPGREVIAPADGRALDPTGSLGVEGVPVRTTAYVATRLTISRTTPIPDEELPTDGRRTGGLQGAHLEGHKRHRVDARFALIADVADELGWVATLEPEDPKTV